MNGASIEAIRSSAWNQPRSRIHPHHLPELSENDARVCEGGSKMAKTVVAIGMRQDAMKRSKEKSSEIRGRRSMRRKNCRN
jgi:hypothetical protein